jgi:hypothetical protein
MCVNLQLKIFLFSFSGFWMLSLWSCSVYKFFSCFFYLVIRIPISDEHWSFRWLIMPFICVHRRWRTTNITGDPIRYERYGMLVLFHLFWCVIKKSAMATIFRPANWKINLLRSDLFVPILSKVLNSQFFYRLIGISHSSDPRWPNNLCNFVCLILIYEFPDAGSTMVMKMTWVKIRQHQHYMKWTSWFH